MITCKGLIVGVVKNANRQDVLNQCASFLKNHKNLGYCAQFEIDNMVYATSIDVCEDDDYSVLFRLHNGSVAMGIA